MRGKLEKLARDFVGLDVNTIQEMTDTELIFEILEVLTDKTEELDGHSHTIS